jgi:hypothetical protein
MTARLPEIVRVVLPALRSAALPGALCVAALASAGCASRTPPARGIVEQVSAAEAGAVALGAPDPLAVRRSPAAAPASPDEIAAEDARRRWVEENLGRGRVVERTPRAEPRGPLVERERVVVRDRPTRVYVREDRYDDRWHDRWYAPPVSLSLGWWGGRHWRHGRRGWGWGLGWTVPLYCW